MIFSEVLTWFAHPAHWHGPGGVPMRVAEHLYYTVLSVLIASAVAVPLGLLVGHTGRGGVVVVGLANAMRALPGKSAARVGSSQVKPGSRRPK